jgi:hypothetical protein
MTAEEEQGFELSSDNCNRFKMLNDEQAGRR